MTWETVPLRRLVDCLDGRRIPLNREERSTMQGEVPYWGAGGILDHVSRALFNEPLVLLGEDGAPFFVPGKDVAYYIDGPAWINNHIHALRPRNVEGRFLKYALNSVDYANHISGSTRDKLTQDDLKSIGVPYPPLNEQRRIADFLDAETARIDRLAAARACHRVSLNEREMALIVETLSGSAIGKQRRFTGWPWLASIPEHWKIGPVYAYFDAQLGKMLNPMRAEGAHQEQYLRNANVHWYHVDIDDLATMSFDPEERHRYLVEPGDLLVCEGGAGVAEAAVWDGRIGPCYFQKSLHRVRRTANVPVEWLMYWLRLAKSVGVFEADGNIATIPHLTGEQLRRYRIPIPPDGDRLVARLAVEIGQLSSLLSRIDHADSLLAERKRALITAAVTGQFDVTTGRGADLS